MAETTPDALLILRSAIAANESPVLTTSAEPTADISQITSNIAQASHVQFNHASSRNVLPLTTATRFLKDDNAIDLRSILFAWQTKDLLVPEYTEGISNTNAELKSAEKNEEVVQLIFAEKLDLITWLEGASDESEHIRPLNEEEQAKQASLAADLARGSAPGAPAPVDGITGAGRGRQVDPRLREILNGERRMGSRNTVLRGVKGTDFSHVRKHAQVFITRNRNKAGSNDPLSAAANATGNLSSNTALANRAKHGRRLEPIILLSPSASSLLRMSNIKAFLDEGHYVPPEHGTTDANRQVISRMVPSIDPNRPMRFTLVDTPEMFKPEYWSRVAAVFTTGQTWQFKSYKWQAAPDLFAHALGIYVGWRGDDPPDTVKGWGRGVRSFGIDKWNAHNPAQSRWRDREVVEGIWTSIEESMRLKGMTKDSALTGGR